MDQNFFNLRRPGTTKLNQNFARADVVAVWNKGQIVPGYDPNYVRKDACNAFIQFDKYGDTNSVYGWEVDHKLPVAKGGTDILSNLQPLQWKNNRHKSDDINWSCAVTYKGA